MRKKSKRKKEKHSKLWAHRKRRLRFKMSRNLKRGDRLKLYKPGNKRCKVIPSMER